MMKLVFRIILLSLLLPIFSESLNYEDDTYKYRTKRGWDELNKIIHFKKAAEISEIAIEKIKNSTDKTLKSQQPEWESRLIAAKNRINTYKDLKSNVFPMGPLLSNSYDTHHVFNPGFKTAVEQTMNEVKEVLRQIAIREGQVSTLLIQKGVHPPEVEEVAYRKLEGIPYYNPIPVEDQIDIFGEILTFEKISDSPVLLNKFFNNENWERIYIISIEKLKIHIDPNLRNNYINILFNNLYYLLNNVQENEAYYDISIYKYSKSEPEKLVQLAFMDTTGVYTGEYFNTAFLESLFLCILCLLGINAYLFYSNIRIIPKSQDEELKDKSTENDEDKNISFLDRFELKQFGKSVGNTFIFFLLGIGFSYGIGYGSEIIVGSWTENAGSLVFKTGGILFLLNLAVYPILLVILFKITDYIVVVKKKFYLPSLFLSFSLGIGIYMNFYIEYYNKIFFLDDKFIYVIIMFISNLIYGFILGEIYREIIDLNSKKRFFYFDQSGKKLNHPPLRLILRFSFFIGLIVFCGFIGTLNFNLFLKADFNNILPSILSSGLIGGLVIIKKTKNQFQIPNLNLNENLDEEYHTPKTISELERYLKHPDLIPYKEETSLEINDFRSALQHCMADEGGILLITGGKWAGKKRLLKEILKDPYFKHRTEFKVFCNSKVESKFLPFIEGMKNIPQIESILENIKIGKNTKRAASILSNIFSVVPIAGGLISRFLDSELDLTSKENEKYILDTLVTTVQEISIELQSLSGEEGKDRDQILFLLDNFQDVDESTLHVIEKIRLHLKDPILSPERNYVAFILFLNNDSRFTNEDIFRNIKTIQPYMEYKVYGLNHDSALDYYRNRLNFAANRNNDELFEKIFDMYSEDVSELKVRYISPKYLLETILYEIQRDNNNLTSKEKNDFTGKETDRISVLSGKFIYNGQPLKVNISESIYKDYNARINKLDPSEIEILEVASVLGNVFNISEVSYILNLDNVTIGKKIKTIERDGDIIRRLDTSGEFIFRKGIYREVFKKRIFSTLTFEGEEIPYQVFTEYCNRGVEYFKNKGIKNLTQEEIKRYAHISYYSSRKYLNDFIEANLVYAEYAYTIPDLQIDGITSLEKIIIQIKLEKNDLLVFLINNRFLEQFISILSFYIIDYQKLIMGNFNHLIPIIEILYENHETFYETFSPKHLNYLLATYLFTKKPDYITTNTPDPIKFVKKVRAESKDESVLIITNFWEAFLFRIGLIKIEGLDGIDESIRICMEILKNIHLIEDEYWRKNYKSRVLNNLGICYLIKYGSTKTNESKQNAEIFLNQCLEIKESIRDYTGMAMAIGTRSSLHSDPIKQLEDLHKGIEYNLLVRNYNGVAYLYGEIAKLMARSNRIEEKEKYEKLESETKKLNRIP